MAPKTVTRSIENFFAAWQCKFVNPSFARGPKVFSYLRKVITASALSQGNMDYTLLVFEVPRLNKP